MDNITDVFIYDSCIYYVCACNACMIYAHAMYVYMHTSVCVYMSVCICIHACMCVVYNITSTDVPSDVLNRTFLLIIPAQTSAADGLGVETVRIHV